jgi:hypothetical protein
MMQKQDILTLRLHQNFVEAVYGMDRYPRADVNRRVKM